MKRFFFFTPLLILVLLSFFIYSSFFSSEQPLAVADARQLVSALYQQAFGTHPSSLAGRFEHLVRNRVDCYQTSPLQRSDLCKSLYLNEIVTIGRRHVRSAPNMGAFLDQVHYCPIVYSVCMGRAANSGECVAMESRCIDSMLDRYWRGAPVFLTTAQ